MLDAEGDGEVVAEEVVGSVLVADVEEGEAELVGAGEEDKTQLMPSHL